MKKIIFIIFFLQTLSVFSQEELAVVFDEVNQFYSEVDKTDMQSQILFNKGYLFLNDLEQIHKHKVSFCSLGQYSNRSTLINLSALNNKVLIDSNKVNQFKQDKDLCLSYTCIRGDYLPLASVQTTFLNIEAPQYSSMDLSYIACNQNKIYLGEHSIMLKQDYFFSNMQENILQSTINFDDGKGDRYFDITEDNSFNLNYDIVGEKSIKIKIITIQKDTLLAFTKIKVLAKSNLKPIYKGVFSTTDINSPFYSTNKSTYPNVEEIDFEYYTEEGGILDKPIIIAEGFDLFNSRTASDLYINSDDDEIWVDEIIKLKAKGYDIFLVNFQNSSGKTVQDNAAEMQKFIKHINTIKHANGSHHEGIYIGESFGGVVGRIALSQLEEESPFYDHEFGLYLSYDSPHKGVYIPLGAQHLAHDLVFSLPSYVNDAVADAIFNLIFSINPESLIMKMNSVGTKQLMLRHYTGNSTYNTFQNFLAGLDYPSLSRNIAYTNGSRNATHGETEYGERIIRKTLLLGFYDVVALAWYSKRNTSQLVSQIIVNKIERIIIWTPFPVFVFYPVINIIPQIESFGGQPFTVAPGGNVALDNWASFLANVNFTFVPTVSAIDIDQATFNGNNFDISTTTTNVDNLIENNRIPFDDVYTASISNTKHTGQSDVNIDIINQEIMPDHKFLQDRDINSGMQRDFEATETIRVGENVTNANSFPNNPELSTELQHKKHIYEGEYRIKSGATVNMTAGQEITFGDGFTVEEGAIFTASIEPISGGTKAPEETIIKKVSTPQIAGKSKFCGEAMYSIDCNNCDISWQLLGEKIDILEYGKEFTTPENLAYGQYTLYCTKTTDLGVATKSKVIQTQCPYEPQSYEAKESMNNNKKSISIAPNPTSGEFRITSEQDDIISVRVMSITGIVLYNKEFDNTKTVSIDIFNFAKGFYIVETKTEKGETINKRIVKK